MPHRYRVLVIVSVATFVASLDLFIVNIAFPSIQRDFAGTSDATLSWVLSGYAIVTAALLVPAGRLPGAAAPADPATCNGRQTCVPATA